jgi:hypothetical protein
VQRGVAVRDLGGALLEGTVVRVLVLEEVGESEKKKEKRERERG